MPHYRGLLCSIRLAPVPSSSTVGILCRASQDIGNVMTLYQFKPVQAPRGLIHESNQKYPYTPSWFSGLLNEALITFTITEVQVEDEADILPDADALHFHLFINIFSTGHATAAAQVSVPTGKDLTRTRGQATLLCLINNFYPDQVTVSWTMDGKGVSGEQQDSQSILIPDRTYSTSSTPQNHISFSCWMLYQKRSAIEKI
uniref:Ig-like domain-containing protein n=1 Tax=Oncorhynchus mykiss TaxID=8022 RepID=A0A8C7LM24_ONCMY